MGKAQTKEIGILWSESGTGYSDTKEEIEVAVLKDVRNMSSVMVGVWTNTARSAWQWGGRGGGDSTPLYLHTGRYRPIWMIQGRQGLTLTPPINGPITGIRQWRKIVTGRSVLWSLCPPLCKVSGPVDNLKLVIKHFRSAALTVIASLLGIRIFD